MTAVFAGTAAPSEARIRLLYGPGVGLDLRVLLALSLTYVSGEVVAVAVEELGVPWAARIQDVWDSVAVHLI